MKEKKLKSNWYSIEDIRWNGKEHRYVQDPNGYLYSKAKYNTKIKPEDLPEWYIYGRFHKRFGYLSAKGVVDLYYIPNKTFNHFLRDDNLIISYKDKIDKNIKDASKFFWVDGFANASSWDIVNMLKAIKKFSNYDITPIVQQLKDKQQWYKEHFPDDYKRECSKLNLDDEFSE